MKRKRTKQNAPEIVEVDTQQLEELLDRVESGTIGQDDPVLIRQVFESYVHLFALIDDKNTSIARLRKLIFGSTSEKTKDVVGDSAEHESSDGKDAAANLHGRDECPSDDDSNRESSQPPRGHGRHSADDYQGAEQVDVPHDSLTAGDACPECGGGKLYEKTPSVMVRIIGQAPLHATVYRLQRLRCHLCGKVFTAQAPRDAGQKKYDATAASMIGLLKYGSGLPFNRLERLQRDFQIPLPASTQWDVLQAGIPQLIPAYQELIGQAACGDVLYNDDTTIKILELIGQRAPLETDVPSPIERTGVFTSGIVSTRDNRRIALFFSGRQHAGENLRDVLKLRSQEFGPPIQMCDGLSRNLPKELDTILSNCIVHARRYFVDLHENFPDECQHVLEALTVVYHNDQIVREQGMSPEERLHYHQAHSQRTMDALQAWLQRQLDEKHVEPNSKLGGAINYMLTRWDALTLFLREPGAPLDNNICERALKKAILHRKNSLFYKTQNGAFVGDLFMSLIYTCELCDANPFDYLVELQRNVDEVASHSELWMPWNYRAALEATHAAA